MRILRRLLAGAALLIGAGALALWLALRASLPQLEGEVALAGLAEPLVIERDASGTPTVTARSRSDLAFGTGYVHAQDRFFQMDLLRRAAAGEMAELLGPSLIDTDRRLRIHNFRNVARQVLQDATDNDRELLAAYVAGVNAGLGNLRSRPWEYWVLGVEPVPWRAEDSVLVAFAMYLTLNDANGESELARAMLRATLPPEVFDFLHPLGTEWDAPIVGGVWRLAPIPDAQTFDLRRHASTLRHAPRSRLELDTAELVGSNSWAVSAARSANGAALLANDMHLGLRLPNTWYRARLVVRSERTPLDLIGVTLPGLPALVVGSNGHVAWGFTNSYGDWTDLVIVELDPEDPSRYFVGDERAPIVTRREEIKVRGAASIELDVEVTRWGPIVARDPQNRPLALAWTAHHPRATNLRLLDFEQARTVPELLHAANAAGAPVQNVLAVDKDGSIGRVPIRANYDPSQPASWRASGTGWIGWRDPSEYPRVIDPPNGRLWTANTRTLDVETWMSFLGDGGYDLGARASQIRDGLLALENATPADLVRIQLDDRALFLVRWRDLLLDLLDARTIADSRTRIQARELVQHWSGRAAPDDPGYRIVREFRLQVRKDVFDWFTAAARTKYPRLRFAPTPQFEGPLWHLVTQRPAHLLDPRFANWEQALLESLDRALAGLERACGDLPSCTWGRQNVLEMRHPLSSALPFAKFWLDMPAEPLPGDVAMPRVQGTQFGASERLVVAPGREHEGLFQMPGGPVDHPLSPFYGAGHAAWARGEPGPLLPEAPLYRLELTPVP
jgi:penicillin amidase